MQAAQCVQQHCSGHSSRQGNATLSNVRQFSRTGLCYGVQMLEAIQEQELSICVQRQCARLLAMLTEMPHVQVRTLCCSCK